MSKLKLPKVKIKYNEGKEKKNPPFISYFIPAVAISQALLIYLKLVSFKMF